MKPVASYGIVNADTSGPGAFLRAAKWYWDELTDMFSAAGFSSVMIPMVPNTENVSRNGAPICTASIRTRFGSLAGYLEYLNDKDIENDWEDYIINQTKIIEYFTLCLKIIDIDEEDLVNMYSFFKDFAIDFWYFL